jgi:hypothetical protein
MFPLNDAGVVSGVLCGVLFGFVLESAGFGSPCKLTAQFQLRDWSVFKVMFTAIVVAAVGLYGLRLAGLMQADAVFVPTALLVASGVGGSLVGAGFAIGGYCPGTSVVGLFSGRVDALVFLVGLMFGTAVFALTYGPALEQLMAAGEAQSGDTVSAVLGVSDAAVIASMVVVMVLVFYVGSWFERRSQGPVSAEEAVAGAHPQA